VCRPLEGRPRTQSPDLHVFAADDAVAFDHSDNESGKIVFAFRIEPGHFSGFATDQGAAVVLAGFGQAANNFFGDLRIHPARSQVVHKK